MSRVITASIGQVLPLSLLAVGVIISAEPATAGTICSSGTMTGLIGHTCTIGDMDFIFQSFHSDSRSEFPNVDRPTTSDEVTFTPDPTALNTGFTLSGSFTAQASTAAGLSSTDMVRFQILLGVQPLLPDTAIVGISTALSGVSTFPPQGNAGYAFVQSESSNWFVSPAPILTATVGYSFGTYISQDTATMAITPFWGQPGYGLVQVFALAENGGRLSFGAASFHFQEAGGYPPPPPPETPAEPVSSVLFGTGACFLLALAAYMRRVSRFTRVTHCDWSHLPGPVLSD